MSYFAGLVTNRSLAEGLNKCEPHGGARVWISQLFSDGCFGFLALKLMQPSWSLRPDLGHASDLRVTPDPGPSTASVECLSQAGPKSDLVWSRWDHLQEGPDEIPDVFTRLMCPGHSTSVNQPPGRQMINFIRLSAVEQIRGLISNMAAVTIFVSHCSELVLIWLVVFHTFGWAVMWYFYFSFYFPSI